MNELYPDKQKSEEQPKELKKPKKEKQVAYIAGMPEKKYVILNGKKVELPEGVIIGKDGKPHLDFRQTTTTQTRKTGTMTDFPEPERIKPNVVKGRPLFKDEAI